MNISLHWSHIVPGIHYFTNKENISIFKFYLKGNEKHVKSRAIVVFLKNLTGI